LVSYCTPVPHWKNLSLSAEKSQPSFGNFLEDFVANFYGEYGYYMNNINTLFMSAQNQWVCTGIMQKKGFNISAGVAVTEWLERLTENWEIGVQSPVWAKSLDPGFASIYHFQ